jgi:hypothetical protein
MSVVINLGGIFQDSHDSGSAVRPDADVWFPWQIVGTEKIVDNIKNVLASYCFLAVVCKIRIFKWYFH